MNVRQARGSDARRCLRRELQRELFIRYNGQMSRSTAALIEPHGGTLVEGVLGPEAAAALAKRAASLPSLALDAESVADLELLASGGASPLRGFMSHADYRSVLERERLASGTLFPVPLVLPIAVERLGTLPPGTEVALRGELGELRGTLRVRDAFVRDLAEARLLHGTDDARHPAVRRRLAGPAAAISGEVALVRPRGSAFETAREVRLRLAAEGFYRVAAGLELGIPHGAVEVASHADALLVRSLAGAAPIGAQFPVVVARLPLVRRGLGARETLLNVVVLRNFGVSHVVLGRSIDLATAHALLRHGAELGVTFVHADGASAGGRATAPREQVPRGNPTPGDATCESASSAGWSGPSVTTVGWPRAPATRRCSTMGR